MSGSKWERPILPEAYALGGLLMGACGVIETMVDSSMVSCQKGPTRHAYAWQIGRFWQDTLELYFVYAWSSCDKAVLYVVI